MRREPARGGRHVAIFAIAIPALLLLAGTSAVISGSIGLPSRRLTNPDSNPDSRPAGSFASRAAGASGPGVAGASPVLGTGWDALEYSASDLTPPDVHLAVGPNHAVEVVNLASGIFTKAGTLIASHPLATFFGIGLDYITDPQVQYDARADRWFLSASDISQGQVLLAVSRTPDPSGMWAFNRVPSFPSSSCPDQPILGVGSLNVILSINVYSACSSSGRFQGAQYFVLNKTQLVSGTPSPAIWSSIRDPAEFSVHPVKMQGDSPVQYMVSARYNLDDTSDVIELFTVSGSPPGTVGVTQTNNLMRLAGLPPPATQLGSTLPLNPNDFRVADAAWAGGALWVGFNQRCAHPFLPATACIRLLELDPASGRLVQDFDLSSTAKHYFYPAMALDARGNLGIVFGYSSGSDYPGLMATGRLPGDAPELLQPLVLVKTGSGPETTWCPLNVCRYGDYFGASTDPSDPTRIWLAGEVGRGSFGWGTRISAARVKAMLTLNYSVQSDSVPPTAPMVHYVADGSTASAAIGTTPTTFLADPGTAWSVDATFTAPSGQARYIALLNETTKLNGTADRSVSETLPYRLQYGLAIDVGLGGTVAYEANATTGTVASGTIGTVYVFPTGVVRLTAAPSSGLWVFSGWDGDISGPSPSMSITVDGPRSVRAYFSLSWTFLALLASVIVAATVAVVVLRRREQKKPEQPAPIPPTFSPEAPPKAPPP